MAGNRDYFTKTFRSEEILSEIARKWRRAGEIDASEVFNIVDFIEKILIPKYKFKGDLCIEFFERNQELSFDDDPPAFVTYNPLILHVDRDIWSEANLGVPNARFILAHEIGHILLHDNYIQNFSSNPELKIKFSQNEHKVEWQANTFATHFLIGQNLLFYYYKNPSQVAIYFNVMLETAKEATEYYIKINFRPKFSGDFCGKCGHFLIINDKNLNECTVCLS